MKDFRQKSASSHDFAMVPRAEIPRSSFLIEKTLKTSFNSGYLVPIYCKEVLPGDTFNLKATLFCRMATPIFPFMDNLYVETFFFFVPNRLVWTNWQRFMGERDPDPDSSIDYTLPIIGTPTGGYAVGSLYDYFGLPTVGQVAVGAFVLHQSLPLRGYNLIWHEWFRDQNLQDGPVLNTGNGPDSSGDYVLLRRGKRHDYFTSCLPWTQKGDPVELPLGSRADVVGLGIDNLGVFGAGPATVYTTKGGTVPEDWSSGAQAVFAGTAESLYVRRNAAGGSYGPDIYADLSTATAATINAIRLAFQIQRLLERDARGGTRYTEMIFSHFGVRSPDARLQRPEYLGGGSSPVTVNAVANTSSIEGEEPQGNLAAFATSVNVHGFSQSFTEHGYVIGLVNVRADLTYQQGLHRMWSRATRYDFYLPVFAALGEQSVLSKEIYATGEAGDEDVFGYQERWAEYRYDPSQVTGLMRSTSAGSIDIWHLGQEFGSRPVLDATFIADNPPVQRVVAVGAAAAGQEFLLDAFFSLRAARPLPMYSVPGLVDHF